MSLHIIHGVRKHKKREPPLCKVPDEILEKVCPPLKPSKELTDSGSDEDCYPNGSKPPTWAELQEKQLDKWKPLSSNFTKEDRDKMISKYNLNASLFEQDIRLFRTRVEFGPAAWCIGRPLDSLKRQRGQIYNWAQSWRRPEGPDSLSHLTQEQKSAIMHGLQHCCVESDFDTLMGRLPLFMRLNPSGILLECFVWTEALNAFALHQFQYLDGKMSAEDTEEDKTFHLRLEHIYERFYRTNPVLAAVWRADFHRLSLPRARTQSRNLALGKYHRARRDEIVESAVDRFLSNELMIALMGPISEELVPDRREELQLAFSFIEEWMYDRLFTSTGQIEYTWLKGLPRTFSSKEQMIAHELHLATGQENTRLDGHEIIMVTSPNPVIKWQVERGGRLMEGPISSQVLIMDDGKNKYVYRNNRIEWDTEA